MITEVLEVQKLSMEIKTNQYTLKLTSELSLNNVQTNFLVRIKGIGKK